MSVLSNLALSWVAFKAAGMLSSATWTAQVGGPAVTADVLFDQPSTTVLDEIVAFEPSVRFRTADWPGIRERDQIVLGTDTYRVQRVMALDDGATSRAMLAKLAAA